MSRYFLTILLASALSSAAMAQTSAKKDEHAQMKEVSDPVCGMKVDPKTAAAKAEYKGKTYYFCSPDEKVTFEKNPEKFVKTAKK